MYQLQDTPDATATLKNGAAVTPLATLRDEHGGVSHIIEDDHCLVLINGSNDRPFVMSQHWYDAALVAACELKR